MQECSTNCTNSSYIPGIFATNCCQTTDCNRIVTKTVVSSCYQGVSFSTHLLRTIELNFIGQKTCYAPNNQYCAVITGNSTLLNTYFNAYLCMSVCKPESINGLTISCCQNNNCNVPSKSSKIDMPVYFSIPFLISLFCFF